MHRVERVVDVERDSFGNCLEGLAIKIDHRPAHAQQGANVWQILEPRDRRLRAQFPIGRRQIERHLEHRIASQTIGVVAVLIAGADQQEPKTNDIGQAVRHLQRDYISPGDIEEGSGFIVQDSGWVVTASHVLSASVPTNKVRVFFGSVRSRSGDRYQLFEVPGPLVSSDFGLLRFSPALGKTWPALRVLTGHQFSPSDAVTAYGFPFGMEITVRKGTVTNTFGPNGAIGTGAGLAPGMSGGPVVLGNSRCVVGIVTAGANYSGFDWFTPTTLAKPLLDVPPAQFVTEAVGRPAVCDDTKSKRYFLERGGAYLAGHDWDRAIDIYNQAIALYPKEVDFFKDRGEAHLENRDYDAAIKDYDAAISLDPHYAEHYYNRGQAYFGNHDYE